MCIYIFTSMYVLVCVCVFCVHMRIRMTVAVFCSGVLGTEGGIPAVRLPLFYRRRGPGRGSAVVLPLFLRVPCPPVVREWRVLLCSARIFSAERTCGAGVHSLFGRDAGHLL